MTVTYNQQNHFHISGLNDRDLIGVGGKYSVSEAKGEKYVFLYRVFAPSNWGQENKSSPEAGEFSQITLLWRQFQ